MGAALVCVRGWVLGGTSVRTQTESAPFILGAGRIRQMNQSVSVKNLTFRCHFERSEKSSSFLTASYLPEKKRFASADSVFSFRHSAYTQGKGVKDWLIMSRCLYTCELGRHSTLKREAVYSNGNRE